ncbi:MAG: hypothetical protein ACYSU0_10980, partial [Planctomycetota bacterium]
RRLRFEKVGAAHSGTDLARVAALVTSGRGLGCRLILPATAGIAFGYAPPDGHSLRKRIRIPCHEPFALGASDDGNAPAATGRYGGSGRAFA